MSNILHILGGITSSDKATETDNVLNVGFLPLLYNTLILDQDKLYFFCLWILFNIAIGTEAQK